MNSIHDMGGMTGFGPVQPEADEPVFHDEWERRVLALTIATSGLFGPLDKRRHALEVLSPLEYLSYSYYERWLARLERSAIEVELLTEEELTQGVATASDEPPAAPLDPDTMESIIREGRPASRDTGRLEPRFTVGDRVRARNLHPPGHTRLTRYVRGRVGVIDRFHGAHCFPDTAAHDEGENPQPLYSVRFDARELWGPSAPAQDQLFIDLWEDYLEPENG